MPPKSVFWFFKDSLHLSRTLRWKTLIWMAWDGFLNSSVISVSMWLVENRWDYVYISGAPTVIPSVEFQPHSMYLDTECSRRTLSSRGVPLCLCPVSEPCGLGKGATILYLVSDFPWLVMIALPGASMRTIFHKAFQRVFFFSTYLFQRIIFFCPLQQKCSSKM